MPKIIVFPFNTYINSPIGLIQIQATQTHIHQIRFCAQDDVPKTVVENDLVRECCVQLSEYFDGKRKNFSIPLMQEGTEFMQQVWRTVQEIPFGRTLSYAELAKQSGDENLTRAVGTTNGKNQLAILIPCHRVVGSNGKLTGYAWGLSRKQWLLDHEAKVNNTYFKLF